ncbi:hypothetical protein HHI36_023973, partial [Cryptolaemus montrouzieri]
MLTNGYPKSLMRRLIHNTPNQTEHPITNQTTEHPSANQYRQLSEVPRQTQERSTIIVLPHADGSTKQLGGLVRGPNTLMATKN